MGEYRLVPFVRASNGFLKPQGYDLALFNFVAFGEPGSKRALAYFDAAVGVGDKLADAKEENLSAATVTKLSALTADRQFKTTSTFQATVLDLLKSPPVAWRMQPLRPSFTRGQEEIWLGPGGRGKNLFYSLRVGPQRHSKAFADTCVHADGSVDGVTLTSGNADWVDPGTDATFTSNQMRVTSAAAGDKRGKPMTDTECDTDNEYCDASLATFTPANAANTLEAGVIACGSSDGGSGYYMLQSYLTGTQQRSLVAWFQEIELEAESTTITAGVRMKVERSGSSVEGFINNVSVLGPVTDTGEGSGAGFRYVGVYLVANAAIGTALVEYDDILMGDLQKRLMLISG